MLGLVKKQVEHQSVCTNPRVDRALHDLSGRLQSLHDLRLRSAVG